MRHGEFIRPTTADVNVSSFECPLCRGVVRHTIRAEETPIPDDWIEEIKQYANNFCDAHIFRSRDFTIFI